MVNPYESVQNIKTMPPVVESFLDPDQAAKVWPQEIATNPYFIRQIKERKKVSDALEAVTSRLPRPDITLQDAIEQGLVTEQQVAELYEGLSNIIDEEEGKRLILYIPFEFLFVTDNRFGNYLGSSASNFRNTYMNAWHSLLASHDVRANFVDGDVMEPEMLDRDYPRVVKAAHLIPKLVEVGFLEISEVFRLIMETDDDILKASIIDTIPILYDLGYIELNQIRNSRNADVSLLGNALSTHADTQKSIEEIPIVSLTKLKDQLRIKMTDIDRREYGDVTPARKAWLQSDAKQKIIASLGNSLEQAIVDGSLSAEEIADFISEHIEDEVLYLLIELRGIRLVQNHIKCQNRFNKLTIN